MEEVPSEVGCLNRSLVVENKQNIIQSKLQLMKKIMKMMK